MKRKDGFLASVLTLAAGATGAQIITLALMPVITRLYSPEAFGVFAVFVALATVLISISNLQFAEVIVIAPSSADADAAALFSTLIVFVISLAIALSMWVFADPLAQWLGISAYSYFLPLLSITLLLGGLRQIMRRWLLREHFSRHIAAAEVVNAIADRSATIGFYWIAPGTPIGLVMGRLVGQALAIGSMLKPFFSRPFEVGLKQTRREHLTSVAASYSHFPRYSWAVLLDNAAQQLPVLMISTLLGPAIAGGFALARRVLAEPAVVLGAAVAQSYYQQTARAEGSEYVKELTLRLTLVLGKVIALPAIVALVMAPELFTFAFGPEWRQAGWYAHILSPVFMLYFLLRPLNRIFDVAQIQKEKGVYAAQNLTLIAVSLSPAIFLKDPILVLSIYAFLSTIFLTYRCGWLLSTVGISGGEIFQRFRASLILASLCIALLHAVRSFSSFGDISMIVSMAAVSLAYVLINLVMDKDLRRIVGSFRDLVS